MSGLYAINLLACGMVVDGRKGVWMAGWVVRGRRCYAATVGVSRIYWWACPIKPDPSGNLIVNKAEIQTNNTGSSSMGGRVNLEWCGIPTVDLQGNTWTQPTDLDVCRLLMESLNAHENAHFVDHYFLTPTRVLDKQNPASIRTVRTAPAARCQRLTEAAMEARPGQARFEHRPDHARLNRASHVRWAHTALRSGWPCVGGGEKKSAQSCVQLVSYLTAWAGGWAAR